MSAQAHHTLQRIIEAQRLQDYPNLDGDKYFEIFASYQVLKALRFNVDSDEIESGVRGGDGDGGVDSFYVFANRLLIREDTDLARFKGQQVDIEVITIQAKNKPSFEESVPMKFKDFVENCLGSSNISTDSRVLYSSELLESALRFQKLYDLVLTQKPSLKFWFFHVAHGEQIDPKLMARYGLLEATVKANYPNAKFLPKIVPGTELIRMFQKREESVVALKVASYFDFTSFGRDAFGCVVRLKDFYAFITEEENIREPIFEANVRDHAPDATVNEGIQKTLASPAGDDFWWLNNGITILASAAPYRSGQLHITDPMIVNGLQTSHEIFRHFKSGGDLNDERSIMVKVIVNSDDETSNRIIRATNSQTKINSIFLHATEQIHRNIELSLKTHGYFYDRRKNYYRNKGKPVTQIVTIPYLAQSVASIVLQQPDDARVRPGTVAEKNYKQLFSEDFPLEHYTKCVQLMKRCYEFVGAKVSSKTDVLNRVFYLAMYVAGVACNSVKPQRRKIADLDIMNIKENVFETCYAWIEAEFVRLGGDDRTAKGSTLTTSLKDKMINELGGKRK